MTVVYTVITNISRIPQYWSFFSQGSKGFSPDNTPPILDNFGWFMLFFFVYYIIIGVFSYGYAYATLKASRGEKPFIIDLLLPFKRFFIVIFSGITLTLLLGISFLFLIIPAIYFSCRLAFAPYLVIDQKQGVFESIDRSWEMTKGYFWQILLIGLTGFAISLIVILLSLPVLVGIFLNDPVPYDWIFITLSTLIGIPASMYMMLMIGSLYHTICRERGEGMQANAEPELSSFDVV